LWRLNRNPVRIAPDRVGIITMAMHYNSNSARLLLLSG